MPGGSGGPLSQWDNCLEGFGPLGFLDGLPTTAAVGASHRVRATFILHVKECVKAATFGRGETWHSAVHECSGSRARVTSHWRDPVDGRVQWCVSLGSSRAKHGKANPKGLPWGADWGLGTTNASMHCIAATNGRVSVVPFLEAAVIYPRPIS